MAQGQPPTQQQLIAQALAQFGTQNDFFSAGHSQMSAMNNESAAGAGQSQRATRAMLGGNHERSHGLSMDNTFLSAPTDSSPIYPQTQWPLFPTGNSYQIPAETAQYFQQLATQTQLAQVSEGQMGASPAIASGNQMSFWQQQQYPQPSNLTFGGRPGAYANARSPVEQPTYTMAATQSSIPTAQPSAPVSLDDLSFPTEPPDLTTTNVSAIPKQPNRRPARLKPPATGSVQVPVKTPKDKTPKRNLNPTGKIGGGIQKSRRLSSASTRSRALSGSRMSNDDTLQLLRLCKSKKFTVHQLQVFLTENWHSLAGGETMSGGELNGFPSLNDPSNTINTSPEAIKVEKRKIFKMYSGYQKESRPKEQTGEHKFKCTMGCGWSHKIKSNWERHERTHYPPEIWICSHSDCLSRSPKTRTSFRKDLARRHYADHHGADGSVLTDLQLDEIKVQLTESRFPRECVFLGCRQQFTTFDERRLHIENHLKNSHVLERARIIKHYAEVPAEPGSEDDGEYEDDEEEEEDEEDSTNEGHQNRKDDDDDDGDDDYGDDNQNGGNGGISGGQGGNSGNGHSKGGGNFSFPNNSFQQGFSRMGNNTRGGYGSRLHTLDAFEAGPMPGVDERPWKTAKSIRLQLLPQVFARGIAQTPIVLKKIQLQAAMILDLSGVRKTQVINVLRREIAMMASALPSSPGPSIKRFPRLTAMTKLLPDLTKSVSRFDMSSIAKQNQAILKFAGFRKDVLSQELEDPGGPTNDTLHDRLAHFEGGHIYRCFSMQLSKSMTPIRPSRLLHVGTKKNPKLHLDTSEVLPSYVNYCSLSHCWDDGYGLCLSTKNVASLKNSISLDDLTQSFHVAINIARDKGLEYLWIDTLCIMLDSDEDIQAEAPRITQIHASATFSIVVTSVAFDGDASPEQQREESMADAETDWDEKSGEQSDLDMPDLALNHSVEMALPESDHNSGHSESEVPAIAIPPQRRDSHQLESFLAEPSKRSFFSAFPSWNKTSLTLSSLPPASLSHSQVDTDRAADTDETSPSTSDKRPSRIENYLDKWRFQWQRISSSKSAPVSSAASIVTSNSPPPSVSDTSVSSGKRRSLMADLPVAFEKLFRGLRIRHHQQHAESSTPDG